MLIKYNSHVSKGAIQAFLYNNKDLITNLPTIMQYKYFFLFEWTYLVTAYSLRPLWRLMAVKVPIHPRRRRSPPIFHVTNRGLKIKNFALWKRMCTWVTKGWAFANEHSPILRQPLRHWLAHIILFWVGRWLACRGTQWYHGEPTTGPLTRAWPRSA